MLQLQEVNIKDHQYIRDTKWKSKEEYNTLLVTGRPGSGKSYFMTMCAYIISDSLKFNKSNRFGIHINPIFLIRSMLSEDSQFCVSASYTGSNLTDNISSRLFQMINTKKDSIICLDNVLDLLHISQQVKTFRLIQSECLKNNNLLVFSTNSLILLQHHDISSIPNISLGIDHEY